MRVSRDIADLILAGGLSALLFATGVLVPVVGQPLAFFASAPLVWVTARRGVPAGILGGLLAAAVLLPALPPPVTLIYAIEHAAPAWFLGWGIARGRGIAPVSALVALVVTALVLGVAFLFAADAGRDPVQLLEEQLRAAFTELGGSPGGGSGLPALPSPASSQLDEILALLRRVLPAVTLVGIFLECALNSVVAARLLARGTTGIRVPDLASFALPDTLVWVLIPALALALTPQRELSTPALNALIPLLFAYLLQGLSITLHFADRVGLSRLGRAMIAIALVISPWLLAAPLLLGLIDFRFSFRSRWPLPTKSV